MKRTEHYKRVDIPKFWVMEGLRQTANNFKAKGFPQRHGACVGADDEVGLVVDKPGDRWQNHKSLLRFQYEA